MKTITMTVDEQILSRAERKAAALDTSVAEVLACYLRQWAGADGVDNARAKMAQRFAHPDWQFAVGTPDDREQRNARRGHVH